MATAGKESNAMLMLRAHKPGLARPRLALTQRTSSNQSVLRAKVCHPRSCCPKQSGSNGLPRNAPSCAVSQTCADQGVVALVHTNQVYVGTIRLLRKERIDRAGCTAVLAARNARTSASCTCNNGLLLTRNISS